MCGIFALFNSAKTEKELRKIALASARLIRHRGPGKQRTCDFIDSLTRTDWSGIYLWHIEEPEKESTEMNILNNAVIAHERLSIVDPMSGEQPLYNDDKSLILAVNGEIYNHQQIREEFKGKYNFKTGSDCEVIIPLYEKYGTRAVEYLDGIFSFVLFDKKRRSMYAARDHMGIIPLYIGETSDRNSLVFASELKALQGICTKFELFKPGHWYDLESRTMKPWYNPVWYDLTLTPSNKLDYTVLREKFEKAVIKRMMSDVPWGVLLSGGLDSSLVSSVAVRHAMDNDSWPRIHSFSIGLEGSPDLAAAQKVADFLKTKHHNFVYTIQEGVDAINDVIFHLETYDITTIRAATPMYLMSRKIKAMGVKMVLSGEGADEALGGYLYFHKAPNKHEFHKETVNKLRDLHYYDCLRANKAMSSYGVEPRVPFLDKDFLEYVMTLDPEVKMCKVRDGDEKRGSIEKYIMRKAFDTPDNPYLPEEVLWRQKEQFSDGVGYGWIDSLRAKAEREVSDSLWQNRAKRFPYNTPATKEGYMYRAIFESHFPSESALKTVKGGPSIACSTSAAIEWDESFKKLAASVGGDNSGRAVSGVHASAYEDVEAVVAGTSLTNGGPPLKRQKS